MPGHNLNSYIHKTSAKVIQHLVDENGICDHTYPALAAMFGVTVPTIQVVRIHLEANCPSGPDMRLPYKLREDLVLADPSGTLTKLQATVERTKPAMRAANSMVGILNRQMLRTVEGLTALSKDAYARGDTDLGDALDAAAVDYQTRGSLHVMTVKALAALGVTI